MRQCIVCKREVPQGYESDHLAANHLGPHVWWFNMRQYQTAEASMSAAEVKKLGDAVPMLPLIEEREGSDYYYHDAESVDLTRTPHFYTLHPATPYCGLPE